MKKWPPIEIFDNEPAVFALKHQRVKEIKSQDSKYTMVLLVEAAYFELFELSNI